MTDEVLNDVLSRVPMTRRKFVRRVVMGSAFAVPFVASFDMRTLDASAKAGSNCLLAFNQSPYYSDGTYEIVKFATGTSPSPNVVQLDFYVRDATGQNVSSKSLPVTLINYRAFEYNRDDQQVKLNLGLQLPQQIGFHASKTIHPPGYYELTFGVKNMVSSAYDYQYNGSNYYYAFFEFDITVGDDPTVFKIGGPNRDQGPYGTNVLLASGSVCSPGIK